MTPHPHFPRFFEVLKNNPGLFQLRHEEVYRQTLPRWQSQPYRLTGLGSALTGGRWNVPRLMPAVYASSDVRTLLDEAYYKSRRYGWKPADFRTQLAVKMNWRLNRMLDLTDAATLRELGVSKNALKNCDWKASQDAGDEALTQAIARAAFENMAEGLVVPSARNVTGINLVYYPSHRLAGTVIQTLNEEDIPFRHGL